MGSGSQIWDSAIWDKISVGIFTQRERIIVERSNAFFRRRIISSHVFFSPNVLSFYIAFQTITGGRKRAYMSIKEKTDRKYIKMTALASPYEML